MFKTEILNKYYAVSEIIKFIEYCKRHKHELGSYNGSYSLYRKCMSLFYTENAIIKDGDNFDSYTNYNYIKSQMRQYYKEIQSFKNINNVDLEK